MSGAHGALAPHPTRPGGPRRALLHPTPPKSDPGEMDSLTTRASRVPCNALFLLLTPQ